jgi:hypothetical protein
MKIVYNPQKLMKIKKSSISIVTPQSKLQIKLLKNESKFGNLVISGMVDYPARSTVRHN